LGVKINQESAADYQQDEKTVKKIKRLPRTVGVVLMAAGVAGIILPGPIGTPLFVAGGLILAPGIFGRLDNCMKRRLPAVRHHGVQAMERFMADMEKRYPSSKDAGSGDSV
jgi:hypothetical protein